MLSIQTQCFRYRTDKEWIAQLVGIPLILLIFSGAMVLVGLTLTGMVLAGVLVVLGGLFSILKDTFRSALRIGSRR